MTPISDVKLWFLSGVVCIALSSCASYKNITYFKNATASNQATMQIALTAYSAHTIQADDILKVSISTLDPDINGITAAYTAGSAAPVNVPFTALSATNDKYIEGYLVNKEGLIDLPVLGQMQVGGLTIDEARTRIRQKAAVFYKNPSVNLRLMNFRITVLGEVSRPGTYVVNEERISVLDALGLSGDLTIYGKRENVMLIRQDGAQKKNVVRLDLNDVNLMSSPWFYLKQGDVIYVEPGKGKAAATDMAATRTYAIAGSALAVLITLISRINF